MIRVDSVTKVYESKANRVVAVDNVSLDIPSGKIFGILGRSGAGKTTLLRCLNLLERPTSGHIIVDDVDLTALSNQELRKARHRIGMVFQHFNLLASRTAAQNIAFPLEIQGLPKAEIKTRVAELLELVGLTDRANNYPSQLSGGQKQRIGIARALAARPSVLLSDEATSALDPATTEQILDLFKEINAKTGVTVVLITHEVEVVRRICDAAALMEAGKVVEQGNLVDLVMNPESRLADILMPVGEPEPNSVVLTFAEHVDEPVLSQVAREIGVNVSILGGTIETIAGQRVGRLRCSFSHPNGEVDLNYLDQYFSARGVKFRGNND